MAFEHHPLHIFPFTKGMAMSGGMQAWAVDAISAINVLALVQALAPAVTATIAFLALRNWQRQDRAKRQAEFLDALVEAVHGFIVEMHKPIELLRLAKIGMASHVRAYEHEDEQEGLIRGAIEYILARGEHDGKRMAQELATVEPSIVKLQSLMSKGQIFGFSGYARCQNAVTLLTWHFNRLLSFTSMVESPTWNWEHPEVRALLVKVMAIEPDDIRKNIAENDVAIIEFARDTYNRIYG